MKVQRDEAWILRTHALGEADLILSLLAEHHGGLRAVARSARRSRRRFGGALEPLTRVSVTWSEREGRELHRVESLELLRSYAPMQAEPSLQAACAVLAELTEVYSRDGQPDPRSFRLLGACLDALESGVDPWIVVRYDEAWTLRLHGLMPDLDACAACGAALGARAVAWAVAGGLRCRRCLPAEGLAGRRIGAADRSFLASTRSTLPVDLDAGGADLRPAGAVDLLLRGTLELFAERGFRAYRHLQAWTCGGGSATDPEGER